MKNQHKKCDCEMCRHYRKVNGYITLKKWHKNLIAILIVSLGIGLWAGFALNWQTGIFFGIINMILWLIGWAMYERK
jgi:hypothetical protein